MNRSVFDEKAVSLILSLALTISLVATAAAVENVIPMWPSEGEISLEEFRCMEHDARITVLGGKTGQTNGLLNGKCIPLSAGQIKSFGGTIFLPADVLSKALGVTVKGNADGYASIRTSAEAAGFAVFGVQDYQTVELVDCKCIVAQLDADFSQAQTLLTRALAASQPESGQAYASGESQFVNIPALAFFVEGYGKDKWVQMDVTGLSDLSEKTEIGSLGSMICDFVR